MGPFLPLIRSQWADFPRSPAGLRGLFLGALVSNPSSKACVVGWSGVPIGSAGFFLAAIVEMNRILHGVTYGRRPDVRGNAKIQFMDPQSAGGNSEWQQ